jgi:phage shock protein PspC (stress-responsive transcriptional regulator)
MNKLKKSKNKMLFGVCGGLAEYLGVDVSIVRIGFVIGIFATGTLLLWLYLLMALILPKQE